MTEKQTRGDGRFAATLLRASAAGLASATARRLLLGADQPEAPTETRDTESAEEESSAVPGGIDAFTQWRSAAENHVAHLAAALGAGRDEIFADHVRWTRFAFHARGLDTDAVAASMRALSDALRSELPREVGDRASALIESSLSVLEEDTFEPPSALHVDTDLGEYSARYLMALLEGERDEALELVERARADGHTVPRIYQEIFLPALAEVGRLWQLDEVHVAEEHFVTATTSLAISRLYPDLPRAPSCGKTVVTVSVEGELHELGIRIVSDYFAMDGWRVVHLGSSVPGADLRRGIVDFGADLIAISASLVTHLSKVEGLIDEIRRDPRTASTPILVGGRAFASIPGYATEIGASGEARDVEGAVRIGRSLVGLGPTA